jgi:hypothetical protein
VADDAVDLAVEAATGGRVEPTAAGFDQQRRQRPGGESGQRLEAACRREAGEGVLAVGHAGQPSPGGGLYAPGRCRSTI